LAAVHGAGEFFQKILAMEYFGDTSGVLILPAPERTADRRESRTHLGVFS